MPTERGARKALSRFHSDVLLKLRALFTLAPSYIRFRCDVDLEGVMNATCWGFDSESSEMKFYNTTRSPLDRMRFCDK